MTTTHPCGWSDTHDIDTKNKVNGKPVYYLKNQNGGTKGNSIHIDLCFSI